MTLRLKRIYERPAKADGVRILVDRLWPRGVSKAKARVDMWLKEIAPSTELRKWFSHDPKKWPQFQKCYVSELKQNKELLSVLKENALQGDVTLVYAAQDEAHNNAVVIKNYVDGLLKPSGTTRRVDA